MKGIGTTSCRHFKIDYVYHQLTWRLTDMHNQLSATHKHDIADYLGIDEHDLDQCPATLEPTQSPIPLVFEYKVIFSKAVPCSICQEIEDGCCVRVPVWVIEGN